MQSTLGGGIPTLCYPATPSFANLGSCNRAGHAMCHALLLGSSRHSRRFAFNIRGRLRLDRFKGELALKAG